MKAILIFLGVCAAALTLMFLFLSLCTRQGHYRLITPDRTLLISEFSRLGGGQTSYVTEDGAHGMASGNYTIEEVR